MAKSNRQQAFNVNAWQVQQAQRGVGQEQKVWVRRVELHMQDIDLEEVDSSHPPEGEGGDFVALSVAELGKEVDNKEREAYFRSEGSNSGQEEAMFLEKRGVHHFEQAQSGCCLWNCQWILSTHHSNKLIHKSSYPRIIFATREMPMLLMGFDKALATLEPGRACKSVGQ
ncbi:hypothetical protein L0F63_001409 [Massospora cicadina]|nr:hypothetical protein L0F63_001409 [Massospora cicadina]